MLELFLNSLEKVLSNIYDENSAFVLFTKNLADFSSHSLCCTNDDDVAVRVELQRLSSLHFGIQMGENPESEAKEDKYAQSVDEHLKDSLPVDVKHFNFIFLSDELNYFDYKFYDTEVTIKCDTIRELNNIIIVIISKISILSILKVDTTIEQEIGLRHPHLIPGSLLEIAIREVIPLFASSGVGHVMASH